MRYPRPLGLNLVEPGAGESLARLAALEGLTRALVSSVIPLAAFEALGSKVLVSIAYAVGSAMTLAVTLNVARFERLIGRRWVVTMGVVALFSACAVFLWAPVWLIPLGIGLVSVEASVFTVGLSLYVMDYVAKADLVLVESRRTFYLAAVWLAGPALGAWLWSQAGAPVPFLLAMTLAIALIATHWYMRFERHPVLSTAIQTPQSALRSLPRFFGQKNLRVAYAVTCLRSIFWVMAFVYGPIYVLEAGLSEWVAGLFLSAAGSILWISPAVRRVANQVGVRKVMSRAFALSSVSMFGLALIGDPRPVGLLLWFTAALGAGAVDILGNIPFMRLVKPRERNAMATVFATWREVSFLAAPLLAGALLLVGPFWLLWTATAVCMALGLLATTFLPRRL